MLRPIVGKMLGLLLIAGGMAACDSSSTTGPGDDLVVIQAFLYAGEPVTDIRVTGILALGSDTTAASPINDAGVYLIRGGIRFDLVSSPGDSGYYHYDGIDLTVAAGDEFEIGVVYAGTTATGTTIVPTAPANVDGSADTIEVPENLFDIDETVITSTELTWDEVDGALWYVTVENIESDPVEIERFGGGFGGNRGPQRFISPPRSMNAYLVRSQTLTHYGEHLVRVYRINQEYADLYGSRQQDTRDLNEPLTNIRNGLGVFSAFNSAVDTFTVIPQR